DDANLVVIIFGEKKQLSAIWRKRHAAVAHHRRPSLQTHLERAQLVTSRKIPNARGVAYGYESIVGSEADEVDAERSHDRALTATAESLQFAPAQHVPNSDRIIATRCGDETTVATKRDS